PRRECAAAIVTAKPGRRRFQCAGRNSPGALSACCLRAERRNARGTLIRSQRSSGMAITLYHDVPSSNSDRVKIALAEKQPEFLQLNPYGKIPVLVEDGHVLFESCIINEYLDEKYPDPLLMPKDP